MTFKTITDADKIKALRVALSELLEQIKNVDMTVDVHKYYKSEFVWASVLNNAHKVLQETQP